QVATRLASQGHSVFGIDARGWPDAPAGIEVARVDIRKRAAEDVFRKRRPQAVVHMATVSALAAQAEERSRINLDGTKAAFDYCRAYGVSQIVFVGRHTFYGAAADSPMS